MKKRISFITFLFINIFLFSEEIFFSKIDINESFNSVSSKINLYSSLSQLEDNYYSTEIFDNGSIRNKLILGFSNNSVNLIMDYYLIPDEETFLDIKNHIETFLNKNYQSKYSNNHLSWSNSKVTIRTFSSRIQMDGEKGFTYWVMYAGKTDWSAYKYIYEPFKFNFTPEFPNNTLVYWEMNTDEISFTHNHPDVKTLSNGKFRKIIKNDYEVIYVDYLFEKNKLSNIILNFEFSSREEQKNFFNNLMINYSEKYGDGEFQSYDKDSYQHYLLSGSKLITNSLITISYYSRDYVLDQLNKNNYLVSLSFKGV